MRHLIPVVLALLFATGCRPPSAPERRPSGPVLPGAWQVDSYLPLLHHKRVGLVVNHTSRVAGTHLVDTLLARGIEIVTLFAPEHGFRGTADAGEKIADSTDPATGLPVISLYGRHRKPTAEDLANLDILVFDIQDVGVRFYTYISTLHLVMEACAENDKPLVVLDRPNPNGHYVAGPVLDTAFRSFVGMHPIPVVYGLTLGELAGMINGEGWLAGGRTCRIQVVRNSHYTHSTPYSLPVRPSPNLPNDRAVALYPSLCLFEPTVISIGRGTPFPFQVIGYPDSTFGTFRFTPRSIPGMSRYPKHEGRTCYGEDLRQGDSARFTLTYLLKYYRLYGGGETFFTSPAFFDKLAGDSILRHQLLAGKTREEIETSWQAKLTAYRVLRKKYLLYPDFE